MAPRSRLLLPLAVACGVLAAGAGSAQAASITAESGKLVVRAAPGEKNWVSLGMSAYEANMVELDDLQAFDYDPGLCAPAYGEGFTAVVCTPQPGGVLIEVADGDDIVDSGEVAGAITIRAGAGNDVVRGGENAEAIDGGDGADKLEGRGGADTIDGGAGNDPVLEGQGGADTVRGGAGDDTLRGDKHNDPASADVLDGGAGYDQIDGDWSVEYGQHQPPIAVSEDGVANDGRPGENDDVAAIERIYLNAPAALHGDAADDDYAVFNTDEGPSTLTGGGGNDKLSAFDYDDTVDGGAGNDTLTGGYGNDTITGGPGRDTIYADVSSTTCNYIQCRLPQGNDTVRARDGEADQIDCGVGTDTAYVDAVDTVSNSCETIVKGDGPAPGPGTGPDGPGGDGGLTAIARKVPLRKALARGLVLDAYAPGAGRISVVARKGGKAVASGRARAAGQGTVAVKLRFTKAAKRSLKRARKVKLAFAITFRPAQGAAVKGRAAATLRP